MKFVYSRYFSSPFYFGEKCVEIKAGPKKREENQFHHTDLHCLQFRYCYSLFHSSSFPNTLENQRNTRSHCANRIKKGTTTKTRRIKNKDNNLYREQLRFLLNHSIMRNLLSFCGVCMCVCSFCRHIAAYFSIRYLFAFELILLACSLSFIVIWWLVLPLFTNQKSQRKQQ